MASRKTVTLEARRKELVIVDNAYIRVNAVSGSKNKVVAQVGFYGSEPKLKEIPSADGQPVAPNWDSNFVCTKEYSFVPDMNGANFIAQAYEALKKEPEFADAVDC
jgi:hypothetical protein